MPAEDKPTEQVIRPATNKDIEMLLLYFERRLETQKRSIELSLFWAVVALVILLAPEYFEVVVGALVDSVLFVVALVTAFFQASS